MGDKPATRDRKVARVAARQHGLISTAQLSQAGIDRAATLRRVRAGRLHPVHRGVYAVGHPGLPFEGRLLAAVLAGGAGAVLSHRSAAELWGILPRTHGSIHITVPTHNGREKRRGIVVHRSITLGPESIDERSATPLTSPIRTLADLRRRLDPDLHQRAFRRALDLGLLAASSLGPDPDLTRSVLERRFIALCRRHRLPRPEVNARVGRYEVDFLWREARVIAEADGFRYHGTRRAFERDRARDADLQAQGYRVLRVTARQLGHSPKQVVRSLQALLGS